MAKLIIKNNGLIIDEVSLVKESSIIGKAHDVDIVLNDPVLTSKNTSITRVVDDYVIQNLEGSRSTLVNGMPISKHLLEDNDVINLGTYELVYQVDPTPDSPVVIDFSKTVILNSKPESASSLQTGLAAVKTEDVALAQNKRELNQGFDDKKTGGMDTFADEKKALPPAKTGLSKSAPVENTTVSVRVSEHAQEKHKLSGMPSRSMVIVGSMIAFGLVASGLGGYAYYTHAEQMSIEKANIEADSNYEQGLKLISDGQYLEATNRLLAAANHGHIQAQLKLGDIFKDGTGTEKDYTSAVRWYKKAAYNGDALSQFKLGQILMEGGFGISKNSDEALRMFRKAADNNLSFALNELGKIYGNGEGVTKDEKEALRFFRLSAEQGDSRGQYNLGVMYEFGIAISKDETQAVRWYEKAAAQNSLGAQNRLGIAYLYGKGVAKDDVQASNWFKKAADKGNAAAQASLGVMYENGYGVSKNVESAILYYRKSAEQGDSAGQYALGNMYFSGRGVSQDYAEAAIWYTKAAAQGHSSAQAYLGLLYERGDSVDKNEVEAIRLYRMSAEQGNAIGQAYLGKMYMLGRGITEDKIEAISLFRKSAEQNDQDGAIGKYCLGLAYEFGDGVKRDAITSLHWYERSAEGGFANATEKVTILQKEVSSLQEKIRKLPAEKISTITEKREALINELQSIENQLAQIERGKRVALPSSMIPLRGADAIMNEYHLKMRRIDVIAELKRMKISGS